MGVAFSLGFCPTIFRLFFLMPTTFQLTAGPLLASIFAIGTAMPLLFFFGLYVGLGMDRMIVKKAKAWGGRVQKAIGVFFILW